LAYVVLLLIFSDEEGIGVADSFMYTASEAHLWKEIHDLR
jgi:hypothetical protein